MPSVLPVCYIGNIFYQSEVATLSIPARDLALFFRRNKSGLMFEAVRKPGTN